jgi:glutamyl-tRNA synthetase
MEALIPKKGSKEEARKSLEALLSTMDQWFQGDPRQSEEFLRTLSESLQIKLGNLLMPLRVAVTGSSVSPPLMESIQILGKEETKRRIEKALELLSG